MGFVSDEEGRLPSGKPTLRKKQGVSPGRRLPLTKPAFLQGHRIDWDGSSGTFSSSKLPQMFHWTKVCITTNYFTSRSSLPYVHTKLTTTDDQLSHGQAILYFYRWHKKEGVDSLSAATLSDGLTPMLKTAQAEYVRKLFFLQTFVYIKYFLVKISNQRSKILYRRAAIAFCRLL
ncbi:hypothetical protein PoB_004953300 [Plakobranchus ocellatus]|uniref:Uncharacterized protein n=1 Tax=Plakobranchus ocellatus TaxID=259542 RepID=A0AAV4BUZ6_9GAST|nr:hypothetical protein PoB_004953300 [Plakobranchus ocellatus]